MLTRGRGMAYFLSQAIEWRSVRNAVEAVNEFCLPETKLHAQICKLGRAFYPRSRFAAIHP